MQELIKLLIGICVLALGLPIGMLLAKKTKEELKAGQKWFKLLIIISLLGGVVSLILSQDALMFSLFFIAIVTSGSLKKKPELRPEYLKKLQKISKGKYIRYNSIDELRKAISR